MRSSTFSYKRMFRNTALAALVIGVLPAYAQIQHAPFSPGRGSVSVPRPAPAVNSGLSHLTPPGGVGSHIGTPSGGISTTLGGMGGGQGDLIGQIFGHRAPSRRKNLIRSSILNRVARMGPGGKVDWNAYAVARQQRALMPNATDLLSAGSGSGGPSGPSIRAVATPQTTTPNASWEGLGPINVSHAPAIDAPSPVFFGNLPTAGRITAAAIDPTNNNIIYVSTPGGGIHKTTDGGKTWTAMTDSPLVGDIPAAISFSSITIDPTNPQILYAGSGDYDGTDVLGTGLYKSLDGGNTWKRLTGLPAGSHCIRKVLVDPKNHNHMYVALGRDQDLGAITNYAANGSSPQLPFGIPASNIPSGGIYSSNDGGQTWTLELDTSPGANFDQVGGYVSNIVYNADATMLYASVDFRGIYRKEEVAAPGIGWFAMDNVSAGPPAGSLDAQQVIGSLPNGVSSYRVDVATSPIDPNTAYFIVETFRTIGRTTDRGASRQILGTIPVSSTAAQGSDPWDQAYYDFYITVGSSNGPSVGSVGLGSGQSTREAIGILPPPGGSGSGSGGTGTLPPPTTLGSDVVYVGLLSLYKSSDGGSSFQDVSLSYTDGALIHTDQHNMTLYPGNPNKFLAINDGGVYPGNYDPLLDGVTFTSLNSKLVINQIYDFSTHPTDPNTLLVGSQDQATTYSSGNLNKWDMITGGDGGASLISQVEPLTQYCSTADGAFYSNFDDAWRGLLGLPFDPTQVNEVDFPNDGNDFPYPARFSADPQFLYAASHSLYQFDDSTRYTACPPKPGKWTKLAKLEPADTNINKFYKNDVALALATSPTDKNWVYVSTAQNALYYSSGGGGAVVDIGSQLGNGASSLPSLPVLGMTTDPLNPKRLWVTLGGTSTGQPHVWRCNDITAVPVRWTPLPGGTNAANTRLPDIPITNVVLLARDDAKAILVSTDIGLYYSNDAGANWNRVDLTSSNSVPLPAAQIRKFEFNASTGRLNVSTFGRGMWRSLVGLTQTLNIQVNMPDYRGSKSKKKAIVDLFHAGQQVTEVPIVPAPPGMTTGACFGDLFAYRTVPVETHTNNLTPAGFFINSVSGVGKYDVYMRVPGALRKKITNVTTGVSGTTAVTLTLGDTNGDNMIDPSDLTIFQQFPIGTATNGPADVDGDGFVTQNDINIVIKNQGKKGD